MPEHSQLLLCYMELISEEFSDNYLLFIWSCQKLKKVVVLMLRVNI